LNSATSKYPEIAVRDDGRGVFCTYIKFVLPVAGRTFVRIGLNGDPFRNGPEPQHRKARDGDETGAS
jgi:hypothetical protein